MHINLTVFKAPILSAALLLSSFSGLAQAEQSRPSVHHPYQVVEVVDGLETPWSMAWLPNGDMLVTERPGRLRIVSNGELSTPVVGLPEIYAVGQGGLFDVVPHPDFATNQLIYLSFAMPMGEQSTTAVIRGRLVDGQLLDVEDIFTAKTLGKKGHYGGRMAFDSEGYLFLSVGDRQASPSGDLAAHPSQHVSNHQGVIVRLHDDGRIPTDNPFVAANNALPEIWSYGHRNPQGLAVHPVTGDLWDSEHGPQGGDEINIVQASLNYGWPVVGYGVNYGVGTPIHSTQTLEGMVNPIHYWAPSIATSGLMIYNHDRFPQWRGNIFVGGLKGRQVARVSMSADGKTAQGEETLLLNDGRVRDIRQGPEGYIYVALESAGKIVRLEPAR